MNEARRHPPKKTFPSLVVQDYIYLAGAASGDANAIADDLVIGDGSATARGLTIFTASSADGYILFADSASQTAGGFTYDHGADLLRLRAGAGDRVYVSAAEVAPNTDAAIALGLTQNRGWQCVSFAERADHAGTPTATRGEVWLRNDAPNTLMFTDDAGTDFPIGGALSRVPVLADASRGSPTQGRVIFNTDDGNLNIGDGSNWILPDGTTT